MNCKKTLMGSFHAIFLVSSMSVFMRFLHSFSFVLGFANVRNMLVDVADSRVFSLLHVKYTFSCWSYFLVHSIPRSISSYVSNLYNLYFFRQKFHTTVLAVVWFVLVVLIRDAITTCLVCSLGCLQISFVSTRSSLYP